MRPFSARLMENSECLLVDCLSQPLGDGNFPVTVVSRALKRLNVNGPLPVFIFYNDRLRNWRTRHHEGRGWIKCHLKHYGSMVPSGLSSVLSWAPSTPKGVMPGGHLLSFDRNSRFNTCWTRGKNQHAWKLSFWYMHEMCGCQRSWADWTVYQLMPLIQQVWCSPVWKGNKVNLTPGLAHRHPLLIEAQIYQMTEVVPRA